MTDEQMNRILRRIDLNFTMLLIIITIDTCLLFTK